jgi:hypothetical protein
MLAEIATVEPPLGPLLQAASLRRLAAVPKGRQAEPQSRLKHSSARHRLRKLKNKVTPCSAAPL